MFWVVFQNDTGVKCESAHFGVIFNFVFGIGQMIKVEFKALIYINALGLINCFGFCRYSQNETAFG